MTTSTKKAWTLLSAGAFAAAVMMGTASSADAHEEPGATIQFGIGTPAYGYGAPYGFYDPHQQEHERLGQRHDNLHDRLDFQHEAYHYFNGNQNTLDHELFHRQEERQHDRAHRRLNRQHDAYHYGFGAFGGNGYRPFGRFGSYYGF